MLASSNADESRRWVSLLFLSLSLNLVFQMWGFGFCGSEKKMEGDEGLRTVDCLRGRLLAERAASRVAKEEAEIMGNRVPFFLLLLLLIMIICLAN